MVLPNTSAASPYCQCQAGVGEMEVHSAEIIREDFLKGVSAVIDKDVSRMIMDRGEG